MAKKFKSLFKVGDILTIKNNCPDVHLRKINKLRVTSLYSSKVDAFNFKVLEGTCKWEQGYWAYAKYCELAKEEEYQIY